MGTSMGTARQQRMDLFGRPTAQAFVDGALGAVVVFGGHTDGRDNLERALVEHDSVTAAGVGEMRSEDVARALGLGAANPDGPDEPPSRSLRFGARPDEFKVRKLR
jgi:hypothetical protein